MLTNTSWTLFLDRDGVINERLPGAYISRWEDFQFTPGAQEAIAQFSAFFTRIIIVTNQQGIGKGSMTAAQLSSLHAKMLEEIKLAKGHVDAIYFCADLKTQANNCRKPQPAMALQAQREFPEITFSRSVMVGDSISDIQFGQQLGMKTVLIDTKEDERELWRLAKKQGVAPDKTLPKLSSFTALLPDFLA
ncbi:MAG: HAD family hydrolase [Saprospiraceae bacterium]|nr:HAD family hydrolase [Saprospiraceae bacterium]